MGWSERYSAFQSDFGMAYDAARDVTVVYGGIGREPRTWEWDGHHWALRAVDGPPWRGNPTMVYDSARAVTVLFGGYAWGENGLTHMGDTWEWDGKEWQLRANSGPERRWIHSMTYDSRRGVSVLYGGFGPTQALRDTWEWNGEAWMLRASAGPLDSAYHHLAYDSRRGVCVLVSGDSWPFSPCQTWEWDGSTWQYRTTTGPPGRASGAMAYDPDRGVTVLFGGQQPSSYPTDTWEWDGSTWVLRAMTGPIGRWHAGMVYDTQRRQMLLYGGRDVHTGSFDDMWTWDGSSWDLALDPPTLGAGLAYDSQRRVTVAFDGSFAHATWEWDGESWRHGAEGGPPGRYGYGMAYDEGRGVTVMFGGYGSGSLKGDTWEWDGSNWSLRSSSGPSPRQNAAMAYDSARDVIVLYGGDPLSSWSAMGDTWEWDGSAWAQRAVTGPSPRTNHAMCYDANRGVVVMFGGDYRSAYLGDTWEYDGSSWTQRLAASPSARHQHHMAFDSWRNVSVLYGGLNGSSTWQIWRETWLWDGSQWQQVLMQTRRPYSNMSIAFDSHRGVTVGLSNEIWEFGPDVALFRQPDDVAASVSGLATFSIQAEGGGPFSYLWRKDGVALTDGGSVSGATTQSLSIHDVQPQDVGDYDVVVANPCGDRLSSPGVLSVGFRPDLAVSNLISNFHAFCRSTYNVPSGRVALLASKAGPGPTVLSGGGCSGLLLDLSSPLHLISIAAADEAGRAEFVGLVGPGTSGLPVWFQTVDLSSCTVSNGVTTVIR